MPSPLGQPDFAETAPAIQIQQLREDSGHWRRIFTGVMAVIVVLIWTTFFELTAHEHQTALDAVAARDANLATTVDLYAVRVFRNARAVHQLTAATAPQLGDAALQDFLQERLQANDAFVELAVCRRDGRVLSSLRERSLVGRAGCDRLRQDTRAGGEITVGHMIAANGSLLVPLTLPLAPDAEGPHEIAVALTPVPTLLGVMWSTRLHDATALALVGDDGAVRAGWRSGIGPIGDAAAMQALANLAAAGANARLDGVEQLVTVRQLPEWNLRVVVASARDEATAGFQQRRLVSLLVCTGLSVTILAAYLVLMRLQAESTRRATSLSRARTRLQTLNEQLDAQVQQRTAQLEQAYRDLESFSYTIAHDVRAPLAAIRAFAGELEPVIAGHGTDKQVRYLARIQANASQMDTLTQHLLELGKLTRAPLRLVRVDVSAIAHEVLGRLHDAEPDRVVETHVQDGLAARADESLLRQVLENLLGNAWKFTGGRQPAQITIGRLDEPEPDGRRTFFVSDNGAGFDSSEAPALFQPFQRMHTASEFPGTGVGLATVQRILALHGGKVWCQSKPDEGATFFFTLREPA